MGRRFDGGWRRRHWAARRRGHNLAVAYYNATGVTQDYVESLKWSVIAVTVASDEKREKYAVLRDALIGKMTPEQATDGQERARAWLAARDQEQR